MPSRFAFTCLLYSDDPRFDRVALVVQKQLSEVGVDMRLEPVKLVDLMGRIKTGDFDAFILQMAGRSLSWVYTFWHSPSDPQWMKTGYTAADTVLDRIRRSTSDDEIQAGVADLTRVFEEDPPAIFLAWQIQSRAVSTRFDVQPESNRDILTNIWQWRPAAPPLAARR
jgi:ABC-type transport system substrate-binding protein